MSQVQSLEVKDEVKEEVEADACSMTVLHGIGTIQLSHYELVEAPSKPDDLVTLVPRFLPIVMVYFIPIDIVYFIPNSHFNFECPV